ncbi:MAG: Rrf2 family transcriptional regulator [Candidatus Omnitrophica bacterium]|nr:Rrf2 family transcriptional regulator [Candidatus Omnitrophota bacterium]MDE2009850.1 Rrf2 family transcriptional regulator [Candidatus Omnitrophota bacterium]MDE2214368.1 Rrf2 family transcriptional regulator [Candidatus Omnitrophota bacterium]MDE2231117.1 Rrf2 family transcriptional regulator [Candidatus Omnitrophota bacterium]
MISKTSIQSINALLELSHLSQGETEDVMRISKKIDAHHNYLGKVLQKLTREGLVVSQKGLNGGFRLAKPSSQIRLYEVVGAIEDVQRWQGCFMGRTQCSSVNSCSAHCHWKKIRRAYVNFLQNTTIADLGKW